MQQPTLGKGQVAVEIRTGNVSTTQGDGYISLELTDPVSGIQFVDLQISFEDFGKIVGSGRSAVVAGELRGLQYVGKTRVTERRSILCPPEAVPEFGKTEDYEKWLRENAQEEGWLVSSYLGSRDSKKSVFTEGGWSTRKFLGTRLHYHVTKYVDV
jgi:hypothetical protein